MKIPKSLLRQIIQEEYAKFSSTEETNKDYMDPPIRELRAKLRTDELKTAMADVAIGVIDQYSDAEGLPGREPGEREAKYGKMTADDARREISDALSAVFDDFLEDFLFDTVEQLINETFPEEEGSEFEDDFGDYATLKAPDATSHKRMKRVARGEEDQFMKLTKAKLIQLIREELNPPDELGDLKRRVTAIEERIEGLKDYMLADFSDETYKKIKAYVLADETP